MSIDDYCDDLDSAARYALAKAGAIAICPQSRSRKSAQDDKWSFCLTQGTLCPRIRRDHEQKTAPEPHTGLQG